MRENTGLLDRTSRRQCCLWKALALPLIKFSNLITDGTVAANIDHMIVKGSNPVAIVSPC